MIDKVEFVVQCFEPSVEEWRNYSSCWFEGVAGQRLEACRELWPEDLWRVVRRRTRIEEVVWFEQG